MKFLKSCAVLMLLSLIGTGAFAQTRTVSGRVLDSGSQPVVGAAVIQQGTRNGVTTGVEANSPSTFLQGK